MFRALENVAGCLMDRHRTRTGGWIGLLTGVECKRADAPTLTPSMRIALTDLKLDRLCVLYPGDKTYSLAKKAEVIPLAKFVNAK